MFALDPAFEPGSTFLTRLTLCEVRLRTDARFPWLILIPRLPGAREMEDLTPEDGAAFLHEIVLAGRAARAMGEVARRPVEKLNIGLLGNITPQLHAHVVGRRTDDPAWPGPVWGHDGAEPYSPDAFHAARQAALEILA